MAAGTADEVVGWLVGGIHLWGNVRTNGRWGASWNRQGGRQQVSHWKCRGGIRGIQGFE